MNIIDYAFCQNDKFDLKGLNEVDSLIFSQLCYFDFEGLLKKYCDDGVKLYVRDIALEENLPQIFDKMKITKERMNFCYAVSQSSRFCDVQIVNQVVSFSKDETKQFSASMFMINEQYCYVAYRGTDASIVGWKEDFMIAYCDGMPSHNVSSEYLNKLMNIYTYPHIYIGGHSKGGNLAVYAAVYAEDKIKNRIVGVYNHDGPGFKKEFFEKPEFLQIKDKIVCIVPENSVVGMIWDNGEKIKIVRSKNLGVFQHNPFSWLVQGDKFAYSENLSGFSKEFKSSLSDWLCYTSNNKKEAFFNAFINIFEKAESKSFGDFFKNIHKNLPIMMVEIHKLDPETKGMFVWVIKKIAAIYVRNSNVVKAGSEVANKINHTFVKVGEKIKDIHNEKNQEKEIKQKSIKAPSDDSIIIDGEIIEESFDIKDALDDDGTVLKVRKKHNKENK